MSLCRSSRDLYARPRRALFALLRVTEGRLTNINSATCKAKLHYLRLIYFRFDTRQDHSQYDYPKWLRLKRVITTVYLRRTFLNFITIYHRHNCIEHYRENYGEQQFDLMSRFFIFEFFSEQKYFGDIYVLTNPKYIQNEFVESLAKCCFRNPIDFFIDKPKVNKYKYDILIC